MNEINVTITQVGNNVISSKIDSKSSASFNFYLVSNQLVSPDAMMLDYDSQADDV